MPALPAVPKCVKAILNVTDDNDIRSINRIYFTYSGTAPTAGQLAAVGGAMGTAWGTYMAPLYHSSSNFESVELEDLSSSTAASVLEVTGVPGTRSGSKLPAGVAVNVQAVIARRYRGGKPKTFLAAGVSADLQDRQHWTSAFTGAVNSGWPNFLGIIGGTGWTGAGTITLVNVSYYQGFTNHTYPSGRTKAIPTLRATPVVDTITSYAARPVVGSQRRRNLTSA